MSLRTDAKKAITYQLLGQKGAEGEGRAVETAFQEFFGKRLKVTHGIRIQYDQLCKLILGQSALVQSLGESED